MSWESWHGTIRARVETEIAVAEGVTVFYQNEPSRRVPMELHVQAQVLQDESEQMSFGGATNRYRTPGNLVLTIMSPLAQGEKEALAIADRIRAKFRAQTVGGVTFNTPSLQVNGVSGNHWQVTLTCPFEADEMV